VNETKKSRKGLPMQSKAKTVEEYMKDVPEDRQEALLKLRKLCFEKLIGYEENLEYGMPCYKRKGYEVEVAFASQKNYISLYILKKEVLDKYRKELVHLNLGKGCIRYRKPQQIDFGVVERLLIDSYQSDGEVC
jgi:uncharacterized protein YdhG (YjbR/CyaY superfamily)